MKIIKSTLLLVSMLFVFSSCDELDELTEFDSNFTLTERMDISVAEGDEETQTFSNTVTFNLADDDDVADNLNAIESVTINSLTYRFSNVVGSEEATITEAQITVGSTAIALEPIAPRVAGSQVFEVSDTSRLNTIATYLRNNPEAALLYSGAVTNAPLDFTITVSMDVTAIIDPL